MIFIAKKYRELRLVFDPKAAVEVDGRRVTKGLYGSTSGITVEFKEGRFETSDKDIIERMKAHSMYGVWFYTAEKDADEANEGIVLENEKHALAEEARGICPECGKRFKNDFALDKHLSTHDKVE